VVRLPMGMMELAKAEPLRDGKPGASRRVLIVEDNVDAAESLRAALEFAGHRIELAHTGPEGFAKARESRPEVVLCDIGLPGMDGFAVARAIRSDESTKGVFLVALTGYALPDDLRRASEAGFDRHLAKPPNLEQLNELLVSLPAVVSEQGH
jgi:two-component system CheB/CheR fusion protein